MDFFGNTDIGRKRSKNQDCFSVTQIGQRALLCAVFDGMGGHAGGETASGIARDRFCSVVCDALSPKLDEITQTIDATKMQILNVMQKAVAIANTAVFEAAQESDELRGMGTTLAAVLVNGPDVYGINIGDSRIYIVTDKIKQLSHDHSYVQYLVDIGEITEEEAKSNANKSIITRAVGTSESIEGDTFRCDCDKAAIMLCSDGLTNHIDDALIFDIISQSDSAKAAVDVLIDTANENGGTDNITCIVINA